MVGAATTGVVGRDEVAEVTEEGVAERGGEGATEEGVAATIGGATLGGGVGAGLSSSPRYRVRSEGESAPCINRVVSCSSDKAL